MSRSDPSPPPEPSDREPLPTDGPDYHADHEAWERRRASPKPVEGELDAPSTAPDLDVIREALKAATPGPWFVEEFGNPDEYEIGHGEPNRWGYRRNVVSCGEPAEAMGIALPDAHLIANAPTWLASLLSALDEEWRRRSEAEAKRKEWADLYCLAVEEGQKVLTALHKAEKDAVTTTTHLSVAEAALATRDRELEALQRVEQAARRYVLIPKLHHPASGYERHYDEALDDLKAALAALSPHTGGGECNPPYHRVDCTGCE